MFTLKLIKNISKVLSQNSVRKLSTLPATATANSAPLSSILLQNSPWICEIPRPVKAPIANIQPLILPESISRVLPIRDPVSEIIDKAIDEPLSEGNQNKEAARLIVIRRKKMKKHKLKKLRKRMKYEWAKIRQRRELKKEKEFQAVLIAQCKEADAFSAAEYIADKLRQAAAEPPPRFKDTPEFKELMRRKRLRLDYYKVF